MYGSIERLFHVVLLVWFDKVNYNTGGDMEEALNTAIHVINFVNSNNIVSLIWQT